MKEIFRKELVILYIIILFGSFVRFWGVFTNSFAFTYDVGRDMLALWDIAYLHKITLIGATTGLPGVFYGPWWYYMLVPFFIIFSGNPQGIAFTMSLFGIFSIILSFIFGKKISGNFMGLALAGLVSFSSVMISLSSQIWNPNIAPFFVFLSLILLNVIFNKKSKKRNKHFFILGIFLCLSIDIEIVYGILFSLGIVLSLFLIERKKILIKEIISMILGFFVIIFPRVVFEFRHQFLMTKSFLNFLTNGDSSYVQQNFLNKIFNILNILFDQFTSAIAFNNKIVGLIILLFIIISLLSLYKKQGQIIKNNIKICLIVILVFILGLTFFAHDIWSHYIVGLPVFYILSFSISLYAFGKRISNNAIPVLILIIVIFVNVNPIVFFQNLGKPLWEGDVSVYRNQLAVIDYVYNESKGKKFKYVVYTPPVHDYTYQYLFTWYGQKRFGYKPSLQSDLAFFILEPDFQDPSRLENWLRQRQGDGKIIKIEKSRGGIVIQTRIVK